MSSSLRTLDSGSVPDQLCSLTVPSLRLRHKGSGHLSLYQPPDSVFLCVAVTSWLQCRTCSRLHASPASVQPGLQAECCVFPVVVHWSELPICEQLCRQQLQPEEAECYTSLLRARIEGLPHPALEVPVQGLTGLSHQRHAAGTSVKPGHALMALQFEL